MGNKHPRPAPGKNESKSKIDRAIILHPSSSFTAVNWGTFTYILMLLTAFGQDTFRLLFVFIQSAKKNQTGFQAGGKSFVGKKFLHKQTGWLSLTPPPPPPPPFLSLVFFHFD